MPPMKRGYGGSYYGTPKRPRYGGFVSRALKMAPATAASRIQRAFRRRRAARGRFTRRVQTAVMRGEPQQYCIKNLLNQTSVTQAPSTYDISNLYYDNSATGLVNSKWYRTSNKIFVQNMHLDIRVTAGKDDFNKVCIALVRHKRSEPITDVMLQQQQLTPPCTIPQLQNVDSPFLPINSGTTGGPPPKVDLNFGYTNRNANVEALASFFNPKVVDLIWHKTVTVQPLKSAVVPGATANVTFPTGWPYIREFEYNKKMNEIWTFPSAAQQTAGTDVFPTVNNKCYSLICWSDSISSSASHPVVDCSMRLSFKDKD